MESIEESRMELSSPGRRIPRCLCGGQVGKARLTTGPGRMSVTVVFGSKDDR